MSDFPLKAYREKHGLTQEQLAGELGVTGVTVSRWETGVRKINIDLLLGVSRKTGIPARELRPDLAETIGEGA